MNEQETIKIKVWSDCGYVGADRHEEIEVPADATEDEIEEEVRDWFFNHNSYGWEKAI